MMVGRLFHICKGTSGLSQEKRAQYLKMWSSDTDNPISVKAPVKITVPYGPGTELKKLLAEKNLVPSHNCGCHARINQMNIWGPDKCQENLKEIVTWLSKEARKKKPWTRVIPDLVKRTYCNHLIQTAIDRSR